MVAFTGSDGGFSLVHFSDFFRTSLLVEAFWNSIYVATMTVVLASLIAVPLATILARFRFRGAALIHTLGVVPLVMPPFVGAVAMQLIFGRNGSINLLLNDWFGFRIPFMEGLNGVIFVEALHYFPFILLNLSASLSNIDSAMEESAQNLGARGFTLFRCIVFPLAMPGYVAGAALVFVKVFDDLATPLLLNVTSMLAPQAYLKITTVGVSDPMGYVISVIMIVCSLGAMLLSALVLRGRDFATTQRGGGGLSRRRLGRTGNALAIAFVIVTLLIVLSPHIGIFLLSIATVWSYAVLPDAFTIQHYVTVYREAGPLIANTMLYCTLAGLIDIVLGATLAYVVLRTRLPGRRLVEQVAMSAVAIPGLVLGIGLLRTYYDVKLPISGESLATFWFMLVIAYAVRRLPYALSAATAALQQLHVSLEEAAESLGAGKLRVLVAYRGAAHDRRPACGLRHQLRHRRGRTVRDAAAGRARTGRTAVLRHLRLHAVGRRTRPRRGARRDCRRRRRDRDLHRLQDRRARTRAEIAGAVLMARGVTIDHVSFGYGTTAVLDDVSLEVAKGEFFAFLGPSGSGKTTLLRLVAGFGTPSRGSILIGERDVTGLPPWSRNVGMVFQSYALWPHMSVAKNVAFGLERRKLSRAEIAARCAAALDLVGLTDLRRSPAVAAFRWAAAARRARPDDCHRTRGAAARRAALQPRRQAAGRDALRAEGAATQARHHRDLRHPRPGGSQRGRRPYRSARPGPHPADRRADRALRPSRQPFRRDVPRHRQPDRGPHRRRQLLRRWAGVGRRRRTGWAGLHLDPAAGRRARAAPASAPQRRWSRSSSSAARCATDCEWASKA